MKKPLIVFISIFLIQILLSCDPCPHLDGPVNLKVDNPELTQFRIVEKPEEKPNSYLLGDLAIESGIRFDSLLFVMEFEPMDKSRISYYGLGFNQAMACSPAYDENYISDISVTSTSKFGSLDSGQELKNLFLIADSYSGFGNSFGSYSLELNETQVFFRLHTGPGIQSEHIFTFKIELDDGRSFDLQTAPIAITP